MPKPDFAGFGRLVEQLPVPEQHAAASRPLRDAWGGAPVRVDPFEPPKLPTWRVAIVDAALWRMIDPLQPSSVVLWATGEPMEVRIGEQVAARFVPSDAAARPPGLGLSLEAFELLCAQNGIEDAGDVDARWEQQGLRAMADALPSGDVDDGVRLWRGEREVALRQVEALGRLFGVSPEAIAKLTHRPLVLRRTLLEPMRRAKELDAQAHAAEEARARAEAERAVRAAEVAVPKTIGQLGIELVATRKDRLGIDPAPFYGAALVAETDAEVFYGFQVLEHVPLPPFDRDGVRHVDPSELPPGGMKPVPLPDLHAIGFLKERRRDAGVDLGPVPAAELVAEVPPEARALAEKWSAALLSPYPSNVFRLQWSAEVLCRHHRLRPDVAAEVLLDAMTARFKAVRPPTKIPTNLQQRELAMAAQGSEHARPETAYRFVDSYNASELPRALHRLSIERACVDAIARGEFVALEQASAPTTGAKSKKTSTK